VSPAEMVSSETCLGVRSDIDQFVALPPTIGAFEL
jgi:hypothetical protein